MGDCRRRRLVSGAGVGAWRAAGKSAWHNLVQFGRMGRAEVLQILSCRFGHLPPGSRPWVHGARRFRQLRQAFCVATGRAACGFATVSTTGGFLGADGSTAFFTAARSLSAGIAASGGSFATAGPAAGSVPSACRARHPAGRRPMRCGQTVPAGQAEADNLYGRGIPGQQGMGKKRKQHAFFQRAAVSPTRPEEHDQRDRKSDRPGQQQSMNRSRLHRQVQRRSIASMLFGRLRLPPPQRHTECAAYTISASL